MFQPSLAPPQVQTTMTKYRGPIVAIYGPIGCGKTTTADYLTGSCGFEKVSFAAALRLEAAEMLVGRQQVFVSARDQQAAVDALIAMMKDPATKERFRSLLQWLGTYRRDDDLDYWINKAMPTITDMAATGNAVVIDDCRYANEYLALKRHGAIFVEQQSKPGADIRIEEHASEKDWPNFTANLTLPWDTVDSRANSIIGLLKVMGLLE